MRGKGNPNDEGGAYQQAIGILYAVAYTLKMSYKTDHRIDGFYDYVVPPLEGFWWQEGAGGIDYSDKSAFCWISVIRLPDFVAETDFDWAVQSASKKKNRLFLAESGYENDMTASRLHHEIYLSDARKVAPENWKTVIRHPIKKM